MRKGKALARISPEEVIFLDFDDRNFDEPCVISPSSIDKLVWEKFLSIALDDLSASLAPETIIMCEGDLFGKRRKNFDADIYNKIFASKYPNITFISAGACTDLENPEYIGYHLLKQVLPNTNVIRLVDRDDKSDEEVQELVSQSIYVLSRRNLESFLLDDEVIRYFSVKSL